MVTSWLVPRADTRPAAAARVCIPELGSSQA
jgi:hypothetical protein